MSPKSRKKEEKEEEEKEEEEPEVTCPVCGNPVTLEDPYCPHCGAEFEEEEIEEIEIEEEVEEAPEVAEEEAFEIEDYEGVGREAEAEAIEGEPEAEAEEEEFVVEEVVEEPEAEEEFEVEYEEEEPVEIIEEEYIEVEEAPEVCEPAEAPAARYATRVSILDMKVFGIALLILGIIGLQIAIMIKWYWTWVPPITDNIALYSLIGIAVVVVGFLIFIMLKRMAAREKKFHPLLPTISLAIFVLGIIAVVMFLAGGPLSDAIGSNQAIMAVVFVVIIAAGIGLFIMGQKRTAAVPA